MAEPRISTIIPSYNHADYVAQAIESVIAQAYGNHELIVVDDGSADASAEVISSFKDHPLVTVILNEQNRGQSAALCQGLEIATGDFIALLPSDDFLLPHRNAVQARRFAEVGDRVGIVYGRGRRLYEATGECVDVDTPMLRGDVFEHLLMEEEFIYPVTPLIRRQCYDQYRPDAAMSAEGEGLWTKMAMTWDVDYVEDVVGVMRHHERNSGRRWHLTYPQTVGYWERFFDDPRVRQRARAFRRKKLAKVHRTYGLTFLLDAGDAAMARKALFASLREEPAQLVTDWRMDAGLVMAMLGLSRLNPDEAQRPAAD